jgi:xanthine/uracil permease
VLGGGVIVMFGMVVAAGVSMLSDVNWNRRNMVIFAIACPWVSVCSSSPVPCNTCPTR